VVDFFVWRIGGIIASLKAHIVKKHGGFFMEQMTALLEKRVFAADLESFCVDAMVKFGVREKDARIVANVLVTTDTMGVHTHGSRQVWPLMKNVRNGRIDIQASPEVVAQGPGWAVVDGHDAVPMTNAYLAMQVAMQKAKEIGIAYAGVKNSNHFGAAGFYARMALQEDMIGLSVSNVDTCVTVPGSRGRVFGTNPIAYAVPAGNEKPVFLDIATSSVAATKVLAAKALGKSIPDDWLVDDEGIPTTDPSVFPENGALYPMAGHKGYGLALFVEVLAAVMTGAAVTQEVSSWVMDVPERPNEGHAFIAIDVSKMMPIEMFKTRMDHMIREIKNAPKAKGSDRIYLPGEMEWDKREVALREGMKLPGDVILNLLELGKTVGMDATHIFR
jgi:ureidoglycolate dehydrogenase (NAD+)